MATKPVIVGVDGSEESLLAVEWAALEARRHSSPLRIVSAPDVMPCMRAYHAAPAEIAAALRGISARALAPAIARSEEVAPGLPVDTRLLSGPPAVAVADSGADASMLVVGARGAGGFAAMMLGSVSRHVAAWAPCPVAVVREETTAVHREIAVGIRDPQDVTGTLAFAFEEAALRGADLVAVHAWHGPGPGQAGALCSAGPEPITADARPGTWPPRSGNGTTSTRTFGSARTSSAATPPACSPATPPAPTWWCSVGTAIPRARVPASARSSTPSSTTPTARSSSFRRDTRRVS
jgi:nucleotide-binding universal stress UspA family protein